VRTDALVPSFLLVFHFLLRYEDTTNQTIPFGSTKLNDARRCTVVEDADLREIEEPLYSMSEADKKLPGVEE
jgi:hypothetical protein